MMHGNDVPVPVNSTDVIFVVHFPVTAILCDRIDYIIFARLVDGMPTQQWEV